MSANPSRVPADRFHLEGLSLHRQQGLEPISLPDTLSQRPALPILPRVNTISGRLEAMSPAFFPLQVSHGSQKQRKISRRDSIS
jgi:hypothetical protein